MIISIISLMLLVILSIILLLLYKKEKHKLKKEFIENCQLLFDQELEKNRQRLDDEVEEYKRKTLARCNEWRDAQVAERERVDRSLEERKRAVEEIIEQLENRRREAEKNYQTAIAKEHEKIDVELEGYRKNRQEILNTALTGEFAEKRKTLKEEYEVFSTQLAADLAKAREELLTVTEELNEYKKKQAAYNEEILRRRQIEEQQEFFKISLDENSIRDIQILLSIREKLISRENLDKLIYDVYISKPVMEMVKRVLAGGAPSGIYKITRLKTGDIYIGKSTDVKKRWTEHCKTAFGVGSIAHSILHTTMKKDGIENFTFELLEEVPKDKLTEREKYWITFYDSKNYGLNERNG